MVLQSDYNDQMTQNLSLGEPFWIDDHQKLQELVTRVSTEPIIAVDTESDSLFSYYEKVCLIQISTPFEDFLIDPLTIEDLSPLENLFSNPNQLKIFHAAEYDLICMKRDFGFHVAPIFDTMIAARTLGEDLVGLGNLLEKRFTVHLDKRYQRANWGLRPLSPEMLDYARMDTHYLFDLYASLQQDLAQKGLLGLALEDFQLVSLVEPPRNGNNEQTCWKVARGVKMSDVSASILQSLCEYREEQAQKANLPRFKIMSDKLLLAISEAQPHSAEELENIPGFSRILMKRYGKEILNHIAEAGKVKPPQRTFNPRPDKAFMKRLDDLREWRKVTGQELKVESDVILPRSIMESIASSNPRTSDELQQVMQLTPWRFNQYGSKILGILLSEEIT